MPQHVVGTTYKSAGKIVPIAGTTYTAPGEVREQFKVPAGAVNTPFVVEFKYTKVVAYCITLGTQSAAQIPTDSFSEAATGSVELKWNSTSSPVPDMTLNAKAPHVFAPAIAGTVNEFTADITIVYASNAGSTDLLVSVDVLLNS